MALAPGKEPILVIEEIARRSRAHAAGLPQQQEVRAEWSGIGFRVGDLRVLAPMGDVKEILTPPPMSRVPGTKTWVLGIANVRGNLLPVMDLNGYLHARPTVRGKRTRVLVINHRGVFAGLMVDEVMGLRHFELESRTFERSDVDPAVAPYLERGFRVEDETWAVFSIRKLAESPLFLQVAI